MALKRLIICRNPVVERSFRLSENPGGRNRNFLKIMETGTGATVQFTDIFILHPQKITERFHCGLRIVRPEVLKLGIMPSADVKSDNRFSDGGLH